MVIMERIKVCIAGVTGWIGKALVSPIINSPDLALVGAVSRKNAGKDLGEVLGIDNLSLNITGTVREAMKAKTDVLIDYTSPEIVKSNVMTAIDMGVHSVIGTSGLTDADYSEIDQMCTKVGVGVFASGNFAISAALMLNFATIAAKYMPNWEVIDYASADKIDAPSGTAYEIAHRLSKVGKPEVRVSDDKFTGRRESRGVNIYGTHIHSVRLPGYVIGADVIFGGKDEKLTMGFEAGTLPDTYVDGTLLAARKVVNQRGLTRGLDKLLL
jgi:4-hydroxy-tetrahydrodipicolinate reductase